MRIRNTLAILFVVFVFSLNNAFTHTAAESASPTVPTITAQMLDSPKGDAYLSPDGQHIFLIGAAQTGGQRPLCVYSTAGQQEACGSNTVVLDFNSVRWSPDSKWVAFTENFFLNFREPDVWVMNAQTGQITDLTDDGLTKVKLSDIPSQQSIDVIPTWSADSKQIIFLRYHGTDQPDPAQKHKEKADLYQVPPEGGKALSIGGLSYPPNTPPFPTYALALTSKHLAYNVDVGAQKSASNGLWIADADGKNPRQVLKAYGIAEVSFSADGRFVMGLNGFILGQFNATWDQSASLVVSLDDGQEVPIDPDRAAQWAAWSPTGARVAYIVRNPKQPDQEGLYVTEEPGKAGKRVYAGSLLPPAMSARWRSLFWAANNTLLAQTRDRTPLLVQLDATQ